MYSPRLWPAIIAGAAPLCDCQARYTATPAVSMIGCVFTVAFRSASLPSLDQLPQVLFQHIGGFGEGVAHGGIIGIAVHHAARLRALTGKERKLQRLSLLIDQFYHRNEYRAPA